MLIDEMHFRFNLGLDRVASQDRPDMYPNEIDNYLNRAILEFVKDRYGFASQKLGGFETSQERISNLMTLHVKSPSVQPAIVPVTNVDGIYEIRLNSLLHRYLFLTSAKVKISKGDCNKSIDFKNWQIDDMKNTFNEPNFDWGRVHVNFGLSSAASTSNADLPSMYFDTTNYAGEQQFNVDEVHINYIKTPARVCLGTYKHIDDTTPNPTTAVTSCDIDDSFHDEIVNIAVQMAFKDIQDTFGYQTSTQRVQSDK
jgi:hypothetical protein